MKSLTVTLRGLNPMLHHSRRLANPLDPITRKIKELTSKKKKTDDDLEQILKLEWLGGLYYDSEIGLYIPSSWVFTMLRTAARKQKKGRDVEAALIVSSLNGSDKIPVQETGFPKNGKPLDKVYDDSQQFVDVRPVKNPSTGGITMRCRPIFQKWEVSFVVSFEEELINESDLRYWIEYAGTYIGLSEMRPQYGKFEVVEIKWYEVVEIK